jgi:hypothetical protein
VENAVAFFYPNDSSKFARAPQLLDDLATRSREVILTTMKQLACLTLGILMSHYPRADLDAAIEGFVTHTGTMGTTSPGLDRKEQGGLP